MGNSNNKNPKVNPEELADRQMLYAQITDTDAWRLLVERVEQYADGLRTEVGREALAAIETPPGTAISDQMLQSFLHTAFRKGVIQGMKIVVDEPERVERQFEAAFREREAVTNG